MFTFGRFLAEDMTAAQIRDLHPRLVEVPYAIWALNVNSMNPMLRAGIGQIGIAQKVNRTLKQSFNKTR